MIGNKRSSYREEYLTVMDNTIYLVMSLKEH